MTATMPAFKKGGSAAKERAKALNTRPKTNFFQLEEDEQVVVRFIDDSDDWIHTLMHEYVPTKPAPEDFPKDLNWPKRRGAVCRHDDAFAAMYSDCYICDKMWDEEKDKPFKTALRVWARAVIRKPVIVDDELIEKYPEKFSAKDRGKRKGFRDSEIEVPEVDDKGEPTGKTIVQKEVVLICKGMKNFFGAMQAYYDIYGTVLDRDYNITREGKGTETDYKPVPLPEIKNSRNEVFTLQDEEIRARYTGVVDMIKHITAQASDEHYARFFDLTKKAPSRKKDDSEKASSRRRPAQSEEDSEEASPPPRTAPRKKADPAALERMRARVKSDNGRKPEPDDVPTLTDEEVPDETVHEDVSADSAEDEGGVNFGDDE
jgi:hypothetical protein